MTLTLPAPAKINLFLHITGRREDGYHNLQTLFQLLDYGDLLTFKVTECGNIKVTPQIEGVTEQDNLIFLAAKLLQTTSGCHQGCTINLEKRLPMGGGLGGGSSDAATTLVALNHLWQCRFSTTELAELGRQLGADVPVFVEGNSAFAEGIGEQLTPVKLPERWFLVVTPDCEVPTAEIFSHPQLTRDSSPIKIRALSGEQLRNDCQTVVEKLYPQVKDVVDWLADYSEPLMTGTGASVFSSFATREEAQDVLSQLPKPWKAFVARGVNRSTLYQHLP